MSRLGKITLILIVVASIVLCLPMALVARQAQVGDWPVTSPVPLSFDPEEFENYYFQGLVQGFSQVIPILIGFALANVFWDYKTKQERNRKAARYLCVYFSWVKELADREAGLPGNLHRKEPDRKRILEMMRQSRLEPSYQVAAADIADDLAIGRDLSACWLQVGLAIDTLSVNLKMDGGSLGTEQEITDNFRTIRDNCVEGLRLLGCQPETR
jgi:hypothetical protein